MLNLTRLKYDGDVLFRSRVNYLLMTMAFIMLGLFSRFHIMPSLIYAHAGDILWACMVYCLCGYICGKVSVIKLAIMAFMFSCVVELSQLYHADWIDCIRYTPVGGLILGYGFLWSDIVKYIVGICLMAVIDHYCLRKAKLD